MTISNTAYGPSGYQFQSSEIKPTWEMVEFDQEIPATLMKDGEEEKIDNCICAAVTDQYLVYRHFKPEAGGYKEDCRYVFFKDLIIKENADHTRDEISAASIIKLNVNDILLQEGTHSCEKVYESFQSEVDVSNKADMLRVMPYIKRDYAKMSFMPFLEVYIKTRSTDAKLPGVPQKIVRDLYGRNLKSYSAVRIDKNLSAVTGEKRCKFIYLKEQTRAYFDENNIYYFVKNVATGFWQQMDPRRIFDFELELKDRIIDKDLFRNTCAEKAADFAVAPGSLSGNRVTYGSLVAQAVFLSAEQAAKTDSRLFGAVMNEIYEKRLTKPKWSLPLVAGVTGPQLKYLKNVWLPDNLEEFRDYVNDEQFICHYPDIKKRIFAVTVFLNIALYRYRYDRRDAAEKDILEASQTFCSLERVEGEKKYHLAEEYIDYLRMRKTYMREAALVDRNYHDHVWQEIKAFGEPPLNIRPSRIHEQHNKIGQMVSLLTQKKTIDDYDRFIIARKENEAQEIEYTDGRYSIIMPKDAKDIIREGRILHHCVGQGGYIQAMARKECRILFLRDNRDIDKPLITIEERNNGIRQCYCIYDTINCDPGIRDFIIQFANERGWEIRARIFDDSAEKKPPLQTFLTREEIIAIFNGTDIR